MNLLKSFYDRLPSPVQWLLWCVLVFAIHFILTEFFLLRGLHWLSLVALGTAVFLFLERSLVLLGFPDALETGIAAVLVMSFVVHLGWTYIAPQLAKEELYSQACNPDSLEMKCYLFSRENCQAVWNQYSETCNAEVRQNMDPSRVTALLGPTIKLCTYKKFDKSFTSTRRMEVSAECKKHFEAMDAPSL